MLRLGGLREISPASPPLGPVSGWGVGVTTGVGSRWKGFMRWKNPGLGVSPGAASSTGGLTTTLPSDVEVPVEVLAARGAGCEFAATRTVGSSCN
jgi:hypothetical protein